MLNISNRWAILDITEDWTHFNFKYGRDFVRSAVHVYPARRATLYWWARADPREPATGGRNRFFFNSESVTAPRLFVGGGSRRTEEWKENKFSVFSWIMIISVCLSPCLAFCVRAYLFSIHLSILKNCRGMLSLTITH